MKIRIRRKDGIIQKYNVKRRNAIRYQREKRGIYKRIVIGKIVTSKKSFDKNLVEKQIRKAMALTIPKIGKRFADNLPIGYDSQQKIWIVNDFETGKGKKKVKVPVEIRIGYNEDTRKFNVIDAEIRDKELETRMFQAWLNKG